MDTQPDNLSAWVTPPGEVEPIRVFDTAEAAMRFLALVTRRASTTRSMPRSARSAALLLKQIRPSSRKRHPPVKAALQTAGRWGMPTSS